MLPENSKKGKKRRGGFKLDSLGVGGSIRFVDANTMSFLSFLDSFKAQIELSYLLLDLDHGVDLPFEAPFGSNFWMKLGYFSRRTTLCNKLGPIYVLVSFLSKQIPRSMEEREEDLIFFSIFTHVHVSFF
jgi:hypothetical protein